MDEDYLNSFVEQTQDAIDTILDRLTAVEEILIRIGVAERPAPIWPGQNRTLRSPESD